MVLKLKEQRKKSKFLKNKKIFLRRVVKIEAFEMVLQ